MTPAGDAPGGPFGPFELLDRIGAGGMAEVFEARVLDPAHAPPGLPPRFALKRLLPGLLDDPAARDDFLTEADVAPLLRHPNLVRVFASGETAGRGWLAMERVEGTDLEHLRARRSRTPLPVPLALAILRELLAGLAYLHGATGAAGTPLGLVHRDVTPANVFLDDAGRVKLADLGVARLVGLERQDPSRQVKGKLRYLSPEQVVAEPIGPETDVFATGAILFELLTGRFAFDQDTERAVMLSIRDGRVPKLSRLRPDLPEGLAEVVARALSRKARRRFPSAVAFRDALDAVGFAHGLDLMGEELAEAAAAWVAGRDA